MEHVTLQTLDAFLERYATARGGEMNQETDSEAMFVFRSRYGGAFILATGREVVWVGVQNASARWTDDGHAFPSVRAALERVLTRDSVPSIDSALFYSDDAVSRLKWLADQIERFKAEGGFLLYS